MLQHRGVTRFTDVGVLGRGSGSGVMPWDPSTLFFRARHPDFRQVPPSAAKFLLTILAIKILTSKKTALEPHLATKVAPKGPQKVPIGDHFLIILEMQVEM